MILEQGRVKFGEPTDKSKNKLVAIEDLERLDRIAVAAVTAKGWERLLG